jgi:hypothetical protein
VAHAAPEFAKLKIDRVRNSCRLPSVASSRDDLFKQNTLQASALPNVSSAGTKTLPTVLPAHKHWALPCRQSLDRCRADQLNHTRCVRSLKCAPKSRCLGVLCSPFLGKSYPVHDRRSRSWNSGHRCVSRSSGVALRRWPFVNQRSYVSYVKQAAMGPWACPQRYSI